jgi:hypothetical protein
VQNKTREEAYTYFGHKVALFSELKGKNTVQRKVESEK